MIMQVPVFLRPSAQGEAVITMYIHYWMHTLDHIPQHTHEIENMTRLSPWNGRHLSVNADLCYEPRREGQWEGGRGSPAPGGRESLKEIARGRDRGRSEQKRRRRSSEEKRQRRGKDLRQRWGDFVEGRCSCCSARVSWPHFLGAGQVEAPQGLDHGTEPSSGDPSPRPTKTQQWRWVSGLTHALLHCILCALCTLHSYCCVAI